MRASVAVPTELHPTRKMVMAVMILPACIVRVYIYIRSVYLMRRMSVAGFRGNSTASVLHTVIDRACSAAKPNFFQLTAGEIVPKSSQTPNQL